MVARMVRWMLVVTALSALTVGCKHKDPQGLPPAKDWGTGPAEVSADQNTDNPHAGVDMGTNPHAGVDMSNNPHAMDMGSGMANPHAGMDMGDVTKMGFSPPDPNRPIDPTHHVSGVIKIHPKAASVVKAGTAVFIDAKAEDANGAASGPPLAVEKLIWPASGDLQFSLTEAQAMIGGTQLTGKVVIEAHYSQNGDPFSKAPGDVMGEAHVTVPADNVTLYLDQVL